MAKIATFVEGSNTCSHKWVTREKKNISYLNRVCTECGKEEAHSEQGEGDLASMKKLFNK